MPGQAQIQTEIARSRNQAAYGPSVIPFHQHTGVDGSPILQTTVRVNHVLINTEPATAGNYSVFFYADTPLTILSISEVHTTAGSSGSAVTLQVERLTGTQAPGAGTTLLTAGFNLRATANTVQTGTLINTSQRQLQKGDRLGLVLTGTPTAVANLLITVVLNTI